MKEKYLYPVYALVIILMLFAAGCVEPPAENATFNPLGSGNPGQISQQTTTVPLPFVTEVPISDYTPSTTKSTGYTTFLASTPIPADITCRIHGINLSGNNASAFIFNLKNPPMYINYTVVPTNVTVNRVYSSRYGSKKDETETLTYSDYSPSSWFEVTVRDNATKEIYLQDGFGSKKGYTTYLTRTLKVMKSGDLLVEFRSNDIKASALIWVKPIGNFDESRLSEFTNCMYWDARRDTIATPVPTTVEGGIYTWTPENQVKK